MGADPWSSLTYGARHRQALRMQEQVLERQLRVKDWASLTPTQPLRPEVFGITPRSHEQQTSPLPAEPEPLSLRERLWEFFVGGNRGLVSR